ncbi:hypothetical protein ABN063_17425 [Providencia vermicola]|uniref:hypothetical protein n=1 Tax=Providencia vermicola TaxID=333965 RepID=UPI001CECE730|nr:hypothetical protein [Providencia vermicola]
MRNTASNKQNHRQTPHTVEMNTMSNSMAMLLIYHGLASNTGKSSIADNEIMTTKPTR